MNILLLSFLLHVRPSHATEHLARGCTLSQIVVNDGRFPAQWLAVHKVLAVEFRQVHAWGSPGIHGTCTKLRLVVRIELMRNVLVEQCIPPRFVRR